MQVFKETQKFNTWWMKLIYFGMIALLLYFLYSWHITHNEVNNIGPEDSTGQLITVASIGAALFLFYIFKLKTEIDEIGLHYQFLPFHFSKRTVRWGDMKKCHVRTYHPIKEYGGWGFRTSFGSSEKAYNVKGNKGIQIELKKGTKLLIGTQREKDAMQVIIRYLKPV